MHDAAGGVEREGGCVRPARVDGTSGLACCCPGLLRELHSLLAVRFFAGALSPTNCCLIHCFYFSVPDAHPETGRASVLWRWQRLTSHGTASPWGQRAAGDNAPRVVREPAEEEAEVAAAAAAAAAASSAVAAAAAPLLLPLLLQSRSIVWARYLRDLLRALVVAAAAV